MSKYRLSVFDTCKLNTTSLRRDADVPDTAFMYDTKLTNKHACSVQQWLAGKGVSTSQSLLTYNGMQRAMELMCRWPRPSELFMMIGCMPVNKSSTTAVKNYYRMCIQVSATDRRAFGKLVGTLGTNFIGLGERNDLMYIWLHQISRGKSQVVMYAQYEANLNKALKALGPLAQRCGVSIDGPTQTGIKSFTLSARAKNFEPDLTRGAA